LSFRDHLHQGFFERLAARLFYHLACNGSCLRRAWGWLRARQKWGALENKGNGEAAR
jgi:hypothetical protein